MIATLVDKSKQVVSPPRVVGSRLFGEYISEIAGYSDEEIKERRERLVIQFSQIALLEVDVAERYIKHLEEVRENRIEGTVKAKETRKRKAADMAAAERHIVKNRPPL